MPRGVPGPVNRKEGKKKPRGRPFPKGHKLGGRPKGVPNKFNGLLKEALLSAFNGAHPDGLASWVLQEAKANPTAGLALLGRLIPVSTEGALDATLTVRHVDETAD